MRTAPHSRSTRLSAKAHSVNESPTLALDAKAKRLHEAGRALINLSAGEPDFPTPQHIVEAAAVACRERRYHGYSPSAGLGELRTAVAERTSQDSGYSVDPTQVLITNGAKQAIYQAFAAILDPGDEVLVPTPHWPTYPEAIKLVGGVPVPVVADETSGYRISIEQLEAARTGRTRLLVLASPTNPTGAVYSEEDLKTIGHWAVDAGLWVVTDEIYHHMIYGTGAFHSLPVVVPELRDQCVVVGGVSKSFAMTGWRVGWAIGPIDFIHAVTNLQSHTTSNVCNVAQAAAMAAVTGDLSEVELMRETFDRRRLAIVSILGDIEGVVCPVPQGAFFVYPSMKGLLGKRIHGQRVQTTAELADLLLDQAEVAVVPGEAFGTPGYLRLSYAVSDESVLEGASRIQRFLTEVRT